MDSAKRRSLELERERLLAAVQRIDRDLASSDRKQRRRRHNMAECIRVVDEVVTIYRQTFPLNYMDRDKLMFGGERASSIVARSVTMYLLKFYFNMSYPDIGRVFGKDHSSCQYMAKKCIGSISVPTDEWRLIVPCLDYFGFTPAHRLYVKKDVA